MRVTNNMLVKEMLWNANNNLNSMATRQRELSSGKKIHRPSDDPVGTTQLMKYKTDIREAEQYKKNIDDALGWLEVSESALHNVKDILQRVRELTVQAASGTNTPEDTQKIQIEIDELTKELLVQGNTTNAGRYVFSGLQTNEKLFNTDGTYNIDMTSERVDLRRVMAYEVSVGETLPVGTHPVSVFGVVPRDSFFSTFLNRGTAQTTPSTQTYTTASIDNVNITDLTVNIGGTDYTVDPDALEPPMTASKLVKAISGASDGGTPETRVSTVADVFLDAAGNLRVQSKEYGVTPAITFPTVDPAGALTTLISEVGVDGTSSMITGLDATDADVADAEGIQQLVFDLNGKREVIDIDFDLLTDLAGLEAAINTEIEGRYGLPAPMRADVSSGRLDIILEATTGASAHETRTLRLDYIVTSESEMIRDFYDFSQALSTGDSDGIQDFLGKIDVHLDRVLSNLGEIGGKTNRVEFIKARVDENHITYTALLSKVQDVDMAEAIMNFKILENIYRASLSVGSQVIQPSLVDFIR